MGNLKNEDDDDLRDLLGNGRKKKNVDVDNHGKVDKCQFLWSAVRYQIHNLCFFYPVACTVISVLLVALLLGIVLSAILGLRYNPVEEFGIIHHDHSNIKSKLDLKMGNIDHWCLGGDDHNCLCEDPLMPLPRPEHTFWVQAVKANRQKIQKYQQNPYLNLDVAFLGESIVEEMDGTWIGRNGRRAGSSRLEKIYKDRFDSDHGASVDGVALGIAGDTSSNVLWRLLHGELPNDFNPKVWWIHLGMNDLAQMECSEEVVVIGILRVVEEILEKKPNARIVINSLLPIATLRKAETAVAVAPDIVVDEGAEAGGNDDEEEEEEGGRREKRQLVVLEVEQDDEDMLDEHFQQQQQNRRHLSSSSSDLNRRNEEEPTDEEKSAEIRDRAEQVAEKLQRKQRRKEDRERGPGGNILRKKIREKKDPELKEAERMKRFKLGHMRKKKLPLWTSTKAINGQLKKFAANQERVDFFDATDIFIEKRRGGKKLILRSEYSSNRGHPTLLGYKKLDDAILNFLHPILIQQNDEKEFITQLNEDSEDDFYMYNEGHTEDDEFNYWVQDFNNEDLDDDLAADVYLPHDFELGGPGDSYYENSNGMNGENYMDDGFGADDFF